MKILLLYILAEDIVTFEIVAYYSVIFFIPIFYLKIHVSVIDKFTCIKLFRSSFSTEDVAVNALFLFLYKYFSVTFSQKRHGRFQ